MTFNEFEKRVSEVPDLELNWVYWNIWMPETGLLWVYAFIHALNEWKKNK